MPHNPTLPDSNVAFLVSCIEATPINLDFASISHHMGTSASKERRRYAALASRTRAAHAAALSTSIRAARSTGANVPVNDDYVYLLMVIELSNKRPNFARVSAANGTTKAAARMKFGRLARAIHRRLEADTDSDMEIPF